ncbi:MAG: zinc ribbon domain-containing protein [Desulfobacteraceae bacterium]|jgi:putative FmdB family regulatory protein
MPIYEYECTKCGHKTELWQKITDPPEGKCARCKGKMRKLISQSTFHLKGTGWYVTDYASKHSTDTTEAPADKKSKAKEKSDQSDKKPDSSASEKKVKDS